MKFPRITFNAPVTLSFFLISLIVFLISLVVPQLLSSLACQPPVGFRLSYILGLICYPFVHANWMHFFGNFSMILLIGPILEEKYSSRFLLTAYALTSVGIGLFHTAFLDSGILGASGLVFFSIMLVSMTNFRKGQIPMTLVLVALLYLSKELIGLFGEATGLTESDQISQLGHILGGVCGTLVGYFGHFRKRGG